MKDKILIPYWIIGLSITILYIIVSLPLKNFFWGSVGDELFIGANLQNNLRLNFLSDFFYHNLPPFYPPLYFWIIGGLSSFVTVSAVTAGKIGVVVSLITWFCIPFLIWKRKKEDWILLFPIITICLLPFQDIITKPYEALSALLGIYWIIFFIRNNNFELKNSIFYGITAGLLFLTYYFWWIFLVPVAVIFKFKEWKKLLVVGLSATLTISIYIVPLFISFWKNGIENWQGRYFDPLDLTFWLPNLILIPGLVAMIYFKKDKVFQTLIALTFVAYLYWFINLIIFKTGGNPMQMLKPFHFLITSAFCASMAIGFFKVQQYYKLKLSALIIILLLINPFTTFANLKIERVNKIDPDLYSFFTQNYHLTDRTWLSSGTPELNLYFPIKYYLAHNAQFSHQAALFETRLKRLEEAVNGKTQKLKNFLDEQKITGIIVYCGDDNCPLNFWVDNFPNGGKSIEVPIEKNILENLNWHKVHEKNGWNIYIK